MPEIRFYHMTTQTLEHALPAILAKALERDMRAVVKVPDPNAAEKLSTSLWTYRPDSFLPHGTEKDGYADLQPVYITHQDANPNQSTLLVLTQGQASESLDAYDLCCEMLDGHDEGQIQAARTRWKTYKDKGYDVTYWQQNTSGGWEQKA